MNNCLKRHNKAVSGFSLFELLIAILVLAVGLLGLATMQAQGLKSNNSAELRTEATFLAMDIMERMRASPNNLASYIVDTGAVVGCSPCGSIPAQDLNDWTTSVQNQLGGGAANTWRAQVAQTGVVYTVTLMWDDERTGANGTACSGDATVDMTCFQTLFRP